MPRHLPEKHPRHPRTAQGHAGTLRLASRYGTRFWLTPAGIRQDFRSIQTHLGLTRFHPYMCRHQAATTLVRDNADIESVGRNLGHADITTTAKYLSMTDEDIRAKHAAARTSRSNPHSSPSNTSKGYNWLENRLDALGWYSPKRVAVCGLHCFKGKRLEPLRLLSKPIGLFSVPPTACGLAQSKNNKGDIGQIKYTILYLTYDN